MKKISLILALILILTCTVFAACTESTENKADESENASEVSEKGDNSKEESSKPEEEPSKPETSAPETSTPDTETSTPALEITGENIAIGKTYTVSGTNAGYTDLESDWGAIIYNANLTDGIAHEELTFGDTNNWFGLYYSDDPAFAHNVNAPQGTGTIIIDLQDEAAVKGVKIHFGNFFDNAVVAPRLVNLSLSTNGEAFDYVGSFEIKETGVGSPNNILSYWSELPVDSVNARYVKITVTQGGVFTFLNEIEVYA